MPSSCSEAEAIEGQDQRSRLPVSEAMYYLAEWMFALSLAQAGWDRIKMLTFSAGFSANPMVQ